MNTNEAKEYLARKEVPQLFESLLTGLMYYRPEDPVEYLETCLKKVKELGGSDKIRWDTFLGQEKRTLPPLNGQVRRSILRSVLPDSSNFPYRRYDRLPPIHQFSIESDTDMSETAELIEEYEIFDPTQPHPKIILIIGGPGSGKGTQSKKIAEHYGFEWISVGELLRKKIHSTTSNRKWSLIAKIVTTGELAPQETTITEIKHRLMQLPDAHGIVIDGFPRDVAQALSFEHQICTPDLVIFLACANHRLKERLEKRAEQQGRPDDNPRATERRLTNFKQNAVPLVKFYQEKGLIVTFDADRDEEDVFYDISVTVDSKLFPGREPVAGPSELDLSLIADPCDAADAGSDYDDQADDQSTLSGDETVEEDFRKTKIIFVIGGPGSGKGTLCQQLVQRYGLTHLNTGDLLESTKSSSAIEGAHLIKDTKECGKLVSMDILLDLIKEAMIANMGSTKGFLIDGYPQELWQGEEFENKIAEPSLVLFLECSSETMIKRLLKQNTGDNTDAHSKRVETFCQEAKPVIEYYSKKTHLCKINAEECPENVFTQTCDVIGPIF